MVFNYLKLSFRLLVRNPLFTTINVIGLAVGFASFFALWSYSIRELKSNQYHKDFDRIARIAGYWRWTDDMGKNWDYITFGFTKSDLAPRFARDFVEVEDYTRILTQRFFERSMGEMVPHDKHIVIATASTNFDRRAFKEDKIVYADENLFQMFTIPLIYGDVKTVLSEAGSVVLSERLSEKYFDQKNPIGEFLVLNDSISLKVTGVFKNLPHYTHLDFDLVISNKPYLTKWETAYFGAAQTFVKLRPGSSFQNFEKKINERKKDYWSNVLSTKPNVDIVLFVQPLKDVIFSKSFEGDEFTPRSKAVLLTFAFISIVILAMAWCNYLNLWIARHTKRFGEMATRKVNGATTRDFIIQFIIESAMVNSLALLLAVTILQLVRSPFRLLFNIHIDELWDTSGDTSIIFLFSVILSIALTGIYPAVSAMRKQPSIIFRNIKTREHNRIGPSFLAIIQYTSAIVVILWAVVVYVELNHVLNADLGLDKQNVIVIEAPVKKGEDFVQRFDELSNYLTSHPAITKVTYGKFMPGDYVGAAKQVRRVGDDVSVGFDYNGVNENFISFFGLKLLAGRFFVKDDRDNAIVISRSAAERLGFDGPEAAIGAIVEGDQTFQQLVYRPLEIIGVFEDFRTLSLFEWSSTRTKFDNRQQSRGILLTYKNQTFEEFIPERMAIRVLPKHEEEAIAFAKDRYNAAFPEDVFSWYFLHDRINSVYQNEKTMRNQILLFVLLSIAIACIGFLGITMHNAVSKTKEIGIRKILGAGSSHIGNLVLRTSVKQFLVGTALGVPIAWYFGELYMQKFSERVPLHWWYFVLPVAMFIFIMIGTVSAVVWKAVRASPIQALRYE